MSYRAPVKDMLFVMKELAGIDAVAQLPGYEEAGYDTAAAVLEECAKPNEDVIAPLNREGDLHPSSFPNGEVHTTPGFKHAFRQFAEGGWQGLHHPVALGGQGLPKLIHAACSEMVERIYSRNPSLLMPRGARLSDPEACAIGKWVAVGAPGPLDLIDAGTDAAPDAMIDAAPDAAVNAAAGATP